MNRLSIFVFILFFSSILVSLPTIRVVKAQTTIYIREDGSIEGTDRIYREGDVYAFLGDINVEGSGIDGIIVERDNIILNGAGHNLQGIH